MADTTFMGEGRHQPEPGPELGIGFATEHLYRTLGDVAPGFLWLVDGTGRFIYVNRTWEQYTGSSLAELNRDGWESFNHPDELAQVQARWKEATERQIQFEMELRYRRHDGEYRWMLARVAPIRRGDGAIEGWVGTSVDIDELKRTQQALEQREQELSDFFENAGIPI